MAGIFALGSRRDFDYFDDAGNKWGVRLDESNTRLVNPAGDVGAATATQRAPRNLKLRKIKVIDISGLVVRECTVLKLATFAAIGGATNYTLATTDSNDGTVVAPTLKSPEKSRNLIKNFDSGKNDGTSP
jgi:hypothetical protein